MDNYVDVKWIGEGAHGVVLKAKNVSTGEVVALKKIAIKRLQDGFPCTTLREIKTLQQVKHENVVRLLEVFPQGTGIVLVFEYLVSNLSNLIHNPEYPLRTPQVKHYLQMILKGLNHCHVLGIMHRDLKPANLLIDCTGWLKIADFGLACLISKEKEQSHQVATRWYRAPELLYGAQYYDEGVDLWAVGCIFAEMINRFPLFRGENDIEQLYVVLKALGTPSEDTWPGLTSLPDYNKISFPNFEPVLWKQLVPDSNQVTLDLLQNFLVYDSSKRIRCEKALIHEYFLCPPLPCQTWDLPKPKERKGPHTEFFDTEVEQILSMYDKPEGAGSKQKPKTYVVERK